MIPKKILNYLAKNKIKYEILKHKIVYTSYDLAATLKKKLNEIAKTLIVKTDKDYFLLVLPASRQVDFPKLKEIFKAKKLSLIKENLMKKIFKVKPGTVPPFGSLFKLDVCLDKSLKKVKKIIVRAGSYAESLKIKISDLIKMEKPEEGQFTSEKK